MKQIIKSSFNSKNKKILQSQFSNLKTFLLIFTSAITAQAASNPLSPSLTFSELKALIQIKNVTRVEQVLPLLPKVMTRNPLFVYDSHALNLPLVTPLKPRTILFNEDGSLILAFTQNPGEAAVRQGNDSLEVIRFDAATAKYEIQDIVLNGTDIPFNKNQPSVNPAKCLACHGNNPRPIFQDYNAWPGIYGSFGFSGVATASSLEFLNLKKFLEQKDEDSRYKQLDTSLIESNSVGYRMNSKDYAPAAPAAVFGQLIQRNMEFRLARKMLDHVNLSKVNNLIAYLGSDLNTCGPIRERVKEVYQELISAPGQLAKANELLKKIGQQIKTDYMLKTTEFTKANKPSTDEDPRGILSIFYTNLFYDNPAYDYDKDKTSFENQLVLMQTISDVFQLNSEDISSFPRAPSLGVFHVLRLGLYKDEQFFLGLSEAMLAMNQFSLPRIENSCANVKEAAMKQVKALKIGVEAKIFQPSL